MSMMVANGITTSELCPFCDNPEPVAVRHGVNDNCSFVHDYDCDVCGGDMLIVGYPCPECAVSQPTKDAPDDGESPASQALSTLENGSGQGDLSTPAPITSNLSRSADSLNIG